ncbi:sodium-dependent transporter [Plebeiibacterium sediminum]|uniref:Transporter n=1 Tax=Plebeiibacterium sediminum TaxID=2992112 RepID=A0AAE3SEP1_9BACT|nr:sodium-dependent transporter [Plebeiobacterium sediminum]MCW3786212.1 sodium-dependent transporter [Plebeiobacterium sediminum]
MSELKENKRTGFSSKFGVIAAAAGSAVGLGNIWKFPYITGQYGGAAFLFVYLAFILAIGLPVMMSEFVIGRKAKRNAFGAFRKLAPKSVWFVTGFLGVGAAYLILSFYGVVAGWAMDYVAESVKGTFVGKTPQEISAYFNHFSSQSLNPVLWQLAFMVLTAVIVLMGIQKGIERYSKVLMPLLVVLLVILVFRSVTLPGAMKGIEFFLNPDFSKLTWDGVLNALGHAFFSLSLGMGTLITYGSYIDKKNNLGKTALQVTIADTVIAILAGLVILPAVFAFDLKPGAGAGLVFKTLPNVFMQMPGGSIFSVMFFILLTIAALTSSISILEVVVAFLSEELKISRRVSVVLAAVSISFVGIFCSLSLGDMDGEVFLGMNFFDTLDFFAANIFLPFGGALISLFIGWKYGYKKAKAELSNHGKINLWYFDAIYFSLKYIAPIAIMIVSVYGIYEQVQKYLTTLG